MDPNATLRNYRDALDASDHAAAFEAAEAMANWLYLGGFEPDNSPGWTASQWFDVARQHSNKAARHA